MYFCLYVKLEKLLVILTLSLTPRCVSTLGIRKLETGTSQSIN